MARAHFVSKARSDIYYEGKPVNYISKKGKREGQTLTSIDKTQPKNSKDKVQITKGSSYWWWQFKGGSKNYSLTKPKASQLTQSGYLSTLYDIQDRLGELRGSVSDADELKSSVEDVIADLQSLMDDTQSSLDNMPEQLQEGSILQERVSSLENAISELEGLDLDFDEDEDEEEEEEENGDDDKLSNWLDEKCEEVSNISFD